MKRYLTICFSIIVLGFVIYFFWSWSQSLPVDASILPGYDPREIQKHNKFLNTLLFMSSLGTILIGTAFFWYNHIKDSYLFLPGAIIWIILNIFIDMVFLYFIIKAEIPFFILLGLYKTLCGVIAASDDESLLRLYGILHTNINQYVEYNRQKRSISSQLKDLL